MSWITWEDSDTPCCEECGGALEEEDIDDGECPYCEHPRKWDEDWALERATEAAVSAGCAKSKRGVIIWDPTNRDLGYALGQNSPPFPFICDGSEQCRGSCNKLAVHAEQAALLEWLGRENVNSMDLRECELLHVKVVDGEAVPSGPPSCWQCSRLISEVGFFRKVWLLHEVGLKAYTPYEFHLLTLENCGLPAISY